MSVINNPHDRFFRYLFARQETARDFLRNYLPPPVAAALDLATLELTSDSFVDGALQSHLSDLLYNVRLKDGRQAHAYVLFEHKSYADALVGFQLLRYMVQIWELGLKQQGVLQPIFPVVVYHGRSAWSASPQFQALLEMTEEMAEFVPA